MLEINVDKNIVIRKANQNDDLERISELIYNVDPYIYPYWFENLENCKKVLPKLIYQTDPYIYPFWFKGGVEEAQKILPKYIAQPKFIYNYENMYIAYDKTNGHIVGLICAIDHTMDLNFDYSELENSNPESAFIVKNYIKLLIEEVKKIKVCT